MKNKTFILYSPEYQDDQESATVKEITHDYDTVLETSRSGKYCDGHVWVSYDLAHTLQDQCLLINRMVIGSILAVKKFIQRTGVKCSPA